MNKKEKANRVIAKMKEDITPFVRKLIEEEYLEEIIDEIKVLLLSLKDFTHYDNYTKQEQGFQNGWNDLLGHLKSNILTFSNITDKIKRNREYQKEKNGKSMH